MKCVVLGSLVTLTSVAHSAQLRTTLNGYGNVYRIPVAALALPAP